MLKARRFRDIYKNIDFFPLKTVAGGKRLSLSEGSKKKQQFFQLMMCAERGETVCEVYIATSRERVGVRQIRQTVEDAKDRGIASVVLITAEKVTSFAQRECKSKNMDKTYPSIEMWTFGEFSINVLEHFCQPKISIVPAKNKAQVVKAYGNASLIPRMLAIDPVARFYGATKGTLFQIERSLPGGQTMTVVRIVL
jgi:DNA-directed RNA polymerase subunit H (RpoH/RPB5)